MGEDLRFSFEMPGGHGGVRGTGTVVRAASARHFGVELTHVEGDGRVRIKRYVESGGPTTDRSRAAGGIIAQSDRRPDRPDSPDDDEATAIS